VLSPLFWGLGAGDGGLGTGCWVLGTGCWVFKVLPRASPMGIPMGPSGKVTGSGIISTKILLTRRDPFGRACPKE